MKYLRKFENEAAYSAATIYRPSVSLIAANNSVIFDPKPTHEYVEIAGLKWATMNVGANSVTDTGLYFQWGDTQGYTASQCGSGEGQKYFSWADYKYGSGGTAAAQTKYNLTDGKTVLDLSDDAVNANWGGDWRMPTLEEYQALGSAVTTDWTASYQGSGVSGLVCTDKTDSSKVLFFPAAGGLIQGSSAGDTNVHCWSSSLYTKSNQVYFAYYTTLTNNEIYWNYFGQRPFGFPVRGVISA